MTAEKKLAAVKILLAAATIVYPIIGCLWILAGMIDFARVHNFKRPIFCILPAGAAFQDGESGTFAGLWYSFEIKGDSAPEDKLPKVTEYSARIFNTPVMAESGSKNSFNAIVRKWTVAFLYVSAKNLRFYTNS